MTSFLTLFVHLVGIIIQVSIGVGDSFASAVAPSLFSFTFSIHVFPAYLDLKMRSLPAELPADFYGPIMEEQKEVEQPDINKEAESEASEDAA